MMVLEPSVAYSACDMMHLPLCFGGTVVLLESGFEKPATLKTIKDNKVSIVFTGTMMFDMMLKFPVKPDLSGVELIFFGGSYLSKSAKRRYTKKAEKAETL